MPDKKVEVEVNADVQDSEVEALEDTIRRIKLQKIQMDIDANTAKLDEINKKIEGIDNVIETTVDLSDEELEELKTELAQLESDKLDIQLDLEKGKLEQVKSEIDSLDDEPIKPQVDNIAAMESIEQIGQGFDRLKQGATEIGEKMGVALEAAGKQETNFAFLQNAVGNADVAKSKMEDINRIVQQLPGDDTILQGLLSSAVAKDATITSEALSSMGSSAADYFSAMSYYGKPAAEAQQDMTNYLLAGNTAELERSPILQGHIDKLKEGTTVQERALLLQQALNEEHWGGMSQQDTYNNKLETFNGMLERGQYNLGGLFQEGSKGAMDFILKLDEATNGWVGMGIAAMGFASPLADAVMGLGQMATGMKAIKDLGFIKWLKDLEIAEKLAKIANIELSLSFLTNPIFLVAVAIIALVAALVWAYYNVDWFREMVDNAFASLVQLGQQIYNFVAPVVQWLGNLFNQFTQQLGLNTNDWIQAIVGFIMFLPTLPLQVGIALVNALAKAFGFKGNFVQTLWNTAVSAVQGFADAIMGIPQAVQRCLDWAYNLIMSHPIVQAAIWLGQAIASGFSALGLGQHSPGKIVKAMRQELSWTQDEIEKSNLPTSSANLGRSLADNFNSKLETGNSSIMSGSSGNQVNNFYFEDIVVDDEDRMKRIVNYVAREIAWNNKTAGRSV